MKEKRTPAQRAEDAWRVAAYLRHMAERQRALADEFDREAAKHEHRAEQLGK